MHFINCIYSYWRIIFVFTLPIVNSIVHSTLKRELRYSKFDLTSLNKSMLTVQASSIKQFRDTQKLFAHVYIHTNISEINAKFSVSKCKNYYIDCVNVVSYDIYDCCSKINTLMGFSTNSNHQIFKCPMLGQYNFKNISIDGDKFGTFFSFPTEKWWDHYWRIQVSLYTPDKFGFLFTRTDFYYVEYRSRNNRTKNN